MEIIKKEISPIILLIVSIILSLLFTIVGVIHLSLKSLYDISRLKPWKAIKHFVLYWFRVLYGIWNVIKFLCMQIAIGIDILGNVTTGEAIEDLVTAEEVTLYGDGNITISTATGQLEYNKKLNKTGIVFTKTLSKTLGKDHSVESYLRFLHNQTFKVK